MEEPQRAQRLRQRARQQDRSDEAQRLRPERLDKRVNPFRLCPLVEQQQIVVCLVAQTPVVLDRFAQCTF